MIKGTVDRIVDDEKAVIVIENGEKDQMVTDINNLPVDLRYAGCLIKFRFEDGDIINVKHLNTEEKERRKRLERKFERLSEKLSEE